ncbi:glycosyltransferase family 4 protein [Labilibacter marinus]|uniref:glycosyltransferase family 4 protein n=1 Tax=Labilibacter marinus TaxID=1477105 RepID=UPI000832C68D|nr:glycosyltransferase family 4 protein [Labilibacter marinus]
MKTKIFFFGVKYFPSKGGTSRVVENIIRKLSEQYDISIFCYKNKAAKGYIKNVKTVEIKEFPFKEVGVLFYNFLCTLYLLLKVPKTTIIHAHKVDCALFVPILRLKFKVVLTSHEAAYHRDKWNFVGKLYFKLMEFIFINSGAYLTSISKPLTEYYNGKYGDRVQFIPNGIDINESIDSESAKNILNINAVTGDYVLFAARRVMSTKGLHTMLEALSLVNYKNPIVVAGDLSHATSYVNGLKKKHSDLNVKYIGYVDGLEKLMGLIQLSELFIFPSEIEGMSIMLMEVSASKKFIVSSDIPENTSVFSDEEMLFFENKNSNDLADKIQFAFEHPDEMKDKAENSYKLIQKKYSWTRIAEQYSKIYYSLN